MPEQITARMEELRDQFDRSTPKDRQLRAALVLQARRLYGVEGEIPPGAPTGEIVRQMALRTAIVKALHFLGPIPSPTPPSSKGGRES